MCVLTLNHPASIITTGTTVAWRGGVGLDKGEEEKKNKKTNRREKLTKGVVPQKKVQRDTLGKVTTPYTLDTVA